MWYSDLGTISIGAQCGGPYDGGLGTLKVDLYKLLVRHCKRTYCPGVDHFALLLNISGSIDQFGPGGIQRIRRSKKKRYIAADIVVPESAWQGRTVDALKAYLSAQVREALSACIARIRKDKDPIDAERLLVRVDKAIAQFKALKHTVRGLAGAEDRRLMETAIELAKAKRLESKDG